MVRRFRKRTGLISSYLIWLLLCMILVSGFRFPAFVASARSSNWNIDYSLGIDGEFLIPEVEGEHFVYIESGEQISLKIELEAKNEQEKKRFQEIFSITMPEVLYHDITDGGVIPLEMLMVTEGTDTDLTECGYLLEEIRSGQADEATGSNATTSNTWLKSFIKATDSNVNNVNNINAKELEMYTVQLRFVEELRDIPDLSDAEFERAEIVLTFTSPFETGLTYTCVQNGNNCVINVEQADTGFLAPGSLLRVEKIDAAGNSIITDNATFQLYYDEGCVKPYQNTGNDSMGQIDTGDQGSALVEIDFYPDIDAELETYVEDHERVYILYLQEKKPPSGYEQFEEVIRLEFREIMGIIYLTDATDGAETTYQIVYSSALANAADDRLSGQAGDVLFDYDNEAAVFIINEREPAEIELKTIKAINAGASDERTPDAGEFEFALFLDSMPPGAVITRESGIGIELNETVFVRNDSAGNVDFGTFGFDTDGEYIFKAYEVKGSEKGIFCDPFVYCITVTVEGTVATASYSQWIGQAPSGLPARDTFYFENLAMPSIAPEFKKTLNGAKPVDQEFEFRLQLVHALPYPINGLQNQEITIWYGEDIFYKGAVGELLLENGYEESRTDEYPCVILKSDSNDNIAFDDFMFSELGLYEFRLTQIDDGQPGIIYDDMVYHAGINVVNKCESAGDCYSITIDESYWYYDTNAKKTTISAENIIFKNLSSPVGMIQAQKTLDNTFPEADRFEFGLEFMKDLGTHSADARVLFKGDVLTDQMVTVRNIAAVNAGDVNVLFGELEFFEFDKVNPVKYVFRLSEIAADDSSIKYDETVYYVEITAKYDLQEEAYQLDYIYATEENYLRYRNGRTTFGALRMAPLKQEEEVVFRSATLHTLLPETGGFGTKMFTLGGMMLICISSSMYIYTRKRAYFEAISNNKKRKEREQKHEKNNKTFYRNGNGSNVSHEYGNANHGSRGWPADH